jgi:PEGA domain
VKMNVLKMSGCLLFALLFTSSPVWAQNAETVEESAEEVQVLEQGSSDTSVAGDSSVGEVQSDEPNETPAVVSELVADQDTNAEPDGGADTTDKKGSMRVTTDPAEARVSITEANDTSERELGNSPLEERLSPGTYLVKIELAGYDEVIARVHIQVGRSVVVRIRLVPEDPSRKQKRIAGHVLLWPGIAAAITGIVLIEVDPQGSIGTAGFVTSGTGVAMAIVGSILLGLARKKQGIYEQEPQWTASPTIEGQGAILSFSKTF